MKMIRSNFFNERRHILKFKNITLLMVMVFVLIGCSTINTKMVDQAGRHMPDPSYRLRVIGEPIGITFYYTSFKMIKDVDGSMISQPTYLDFLTPHEFYAGKVKAVTLTIEVNNPKGIEYSLYQEMDMKIRKNQFNTTKVQTGGVVNRSNQTYRQFVYQLPFGKDVRMVDHHVSFFVKDSEVARIGHFRYNLIH